MPNMFFVASKSSIEVSDLGLKRSGNGFDMISVSAQHLPAVLGKTDIEQQPKVIERTLTLDPTKRLRPSFRNGTHLSELVRCFVPNRGTTIQQL